MSIGFPEIFKKLNWVLFKDIRESARLRLSEVEMKSREIRVIYGKDIENMTKTLMEDYKVAEKFGDKSSSIGLKPNLVVATTPDTGATTHMEIVTAVIEYLQDYGFSNISILEGSWVGDDTERAYRLNGYYDIKRRYGVGLFDLKKDRYETKSAGGINMEISRKVLEMDHLINLPVMKGHCQTNMTCAMKNLKGILSDRSKRLFHQKGLMVPIAALNAVYSPSLTIVDSICGDLDFEEGGNPVETGRMMLGEDSVLIDAYCASLMGFDLDDVPYISLAGEMGAGCADIEKAKIIELNKPENSPVAVPRRYASRLSSLTNPKSACSCCYANLIHALKRMDDEGELYALNGEKIAIGQGWKGQEMEIGVGACCHKARHGVVKCPPSAQDILDMLRSL